MESPFETDEQGWSAAAARIMRVLLLDLETLQSVSHTTFSVAISNVKAASGWLMANDMCYVDNRKNATIRKFYCL